ncbi:MAG TPA: aminotransferase class IV [Ktedonobacteraceae bacterium]|jgi:branched-subunit amino acid aminotransferase/4-amino-4-deoxychorismate lyase|nr:aminotransferase class IV [Ktedonobacteraceae bacterium]
MKDYDLFRLELNGVPVQVEDFKIFWPANYGHFTVLPVIEGRVRGLTLHLNRLQQNTQILFGCGIDTSRVLAFVRHAIGTTTGPLSVKVNIFLRQAWSIPAKSVGEPDILVTVRAMPDESFSPLRVQSTQYERDLPQVKHVGTFALTYQHRLAQLHGFDDALFTDACGRISEGSVWNVGFFDGQRIIWPSASALPGVAMQLVQAGLIKKHMPFEVREVYLQDLTAFRSAFLTNVIVGTQAIASIDDVTFVVDAQLNALLKECYEANLAEEV